MTPRQRWQLLGTSAVLWWAAGAFNLFPLGWIALVPFFLALEALPARDRLRWGYAGGFLSFALINWWLIPTIVRGAPSIGISAVTGVFLSLLAVSIIAAGHGLQLLVVGLLWGDKWWRRAAVPFVWTLIDWVRCQGPLAHSWGALGISQAPDGALLQTMRSQHGLTFLCIALSVLLALWWRSRRPVLLIAPVVVLGTLHLPLRRAPTDSASSRHVLVVQTSISSLRKSGLGPGITPFQQAYELTLQGLETARRRGIKVGLIVWPETTASLVRNANGTYSGLDWAIWETQGPKVPLLLGAGVVDAQGRPTNEAILIVRDGSTPSSYAKRRLVPFGERAPLVEYLPFLQIFAPRPALEPGRGDVYPLHFNDTSTGIAPLICFESCFPQRLDQFLMLGGYTGRNRLAVVLTNDEWFSFTEAPRQHRNMGRLRAVEGNVPLVQSANGGESFAVDGNGRILERLAFGEAGSFTVPLPGTE